MSYVVNAVVRESSYEISHYVKRCSQLELLGVIADLTTREFGQCVLLTVTLVEENK